MCRDYLVEKAFPRANQATISLPTIVLPTRTPGHSDTTWVDVVETLYTSPEMRATYGEILESLGLRGSAEGARKVRNALSNLILGRIPGAPSVVRIGRGNYRINRTGNDSGVL